MSNEDIDISSIGNDDHKNYSVKNDVKIDKINILFGEKETKIFDDKKDSLVSFLNELQ